MPLLWAFFVGIKEEMTRIEAINCLLNNYSAFYNIYKNEETKEYDDPALIARCEFYENSKKYVISQKAELWHSDCEEFLYLYHVPHLDMTAYQKYLDYAHQDGTARMHIQPGHMYTYISPVFVCDSMDKDVKKAIKKCRIYKSFKFGLHGWMDVHVSAVILPEEKVIYNSSGHTTASVIRKVLFHIKKK